MVSFMKVSSVIKFIGAESKMVLARSEDKEMESYCLVGSFSFARFKVLEIGCITM